MTERGGHREGLTLRSGRRPRLEGWERAPYPLPILRDARFARSSGRGGQRQTAPAVLPKVGGRKTGSGGYMRSLWVTLSFAVSAFFLAAGATAQDGLQHFEKDIKPQMELKSFTYGSASAIGSSGFVLNNVVAVLPGSGATGGKDTTIKIDKVTADELDFDRMKKDAGDDLPRFMKIK